MVNLTRIYTRTGDAGDDPRSATTASPPRTTCGCTAYADVDELNAQIGVRCRLGGLDDDVVTVLTTVQNDLFDVGADLCTPVVENPEYPPLRVEQEYVDRLEGWCDQYNEPLESLRSLHPPGRHAGAALLHVCRTVARRAERAAWAAYAVHGETMNALAIKYLNRLCDLLFILARHANLETATCCGSPAATADPSSPAAKVP